MCKADVDYNSALLFLLKAIRIDAGEGFDEGGLAVVDMACGTDYEVRHLILTIILTTLLAGSLVYCFLTMVAARNYLRVPPLRRANREPVSILKPLYGADEGLEENLRSFFLQDYPNFEILMTVRGENDPE